MNTIIQGLWIGSHLSTMEQLSVSSFLRNGHQYHLYVYDEVGNVPSGAILRDATEILPAASIFQYNERPSYAGFANFFRYKLLLECGGWWADSDMVCLRPFDFADDYVFSSEMSKGVEVVNCGAIKTPPGSEVMAYAWQACKSKDPRQIVWGETGPRLMGEAVEKHALNEYVRAPHVFCPIPFWEWQKILESDSDLGFDESVYAIHLWNEKWRAAGQDKDAGYPPNSLYEQLKRKYLTVGS
jgi:hypothetical protein